MTSNIQNVGLLIAHGVQKLFGWLGAAGLTGTAAAFEQMGFRPGRQSAVAAGGVRPVEGHSSCWVFSPRQPVQRPRAQ